MLIMQSE